MSKRLLEIAKATTQAKRLRREDDEAELHTLQRIFELRMEDSAVGGTDEIEELQQRIAQLRQQMSAA